MRADEARDRQDQGQGPSPRNRKVTVVKNVKKTVPTQLLLPTVLTAQNGAVVKQLSKIKVEGCQAVKSSKHKKKPKKHKKKKALAAAAVARRVLPGARGSRASR